MARGLPLCGESGKYPAVALVEDNIILVLYCVYIGIMEHKMETATIWGVGFRV